MNNATIADRGVIVWRFWVCLTLATLLPVTHCLGQTIPPTTQPTTLPALSPADVALLKRLESRNWHERRAVVAQLTEVDGPFDAQMRVVHMMLARTQNLEARAELSAALNTIEANLLTSPSLITLHFKKAPVLQVYQAVFQQAHCALRTPPDESLSEDPAKITIDVDRQPFWKVFPKLAQQTGWYLNWGGEVSRLNKLPNGPAGLAGPFRIVAILIVYGHSIPQSTNILGDGVTCYLEMEIFPEPKVHVLRMSGEVKVLEAVDDHGNSMVPDQPADNSPHWIGDGPSMLQAFLKFPSKNPGTRISHLRASAIATVETASGHIEIPDLLSAKPRAMAIGKESVQFLGCKQDDDNYTITLHYHQGNQHDDWDRMLQLAKDHVRFFDSAGKELEFSCNGESDNYNMIFEIQKNFLPNQKPFGVPVKLAWDFATASRDIPATFELKNLNIKVVNGQ